MKYMKINREKISVFIRSAAAGALTLRGVPMAAVSAGWELSASVGVRAGELLAVLIFLLGSSAVFVADELPEKVVSKAVRLCAAMIYAYCSTAVEGSTLVRIADCTLICLSLLIPEAGKRGTITACVLSAFSAAAALYGITFPAVSALLPLAASLISGAAAVVMLNEIVNSKSGFIAGSAAVMLLDMLR